MMNVQFGDLMAVGALIFGGGMCCGVLLCLAILHGPKRETYRLVNEIIATRKEMVQAVAVALSPTDKENVQ